MVPEVSSAVVPDEVSVVPEVSVPVVGCFSDLHVQHFQPWLGNSSHSSAVFPATLEHWHMSFPVPPTTQSSSRPLASAAAPHVLSQSSFPEPQDCVHMPGAASSPDTHVAPVGPGSGIGSMAPHSPLTRQMWPGSHATPPQHVEVTSMNSLPGNLWISCANDPSVLPSHPPSGSTAFSATAIGFSSAVHIDCTLAAFTHCVFASPTGSVSHEPQIALYSPFATDPDGNTRLNHGPFGSRRQDRALSST